MIAALYTDGGLIGRNPSPIGGTWCWCHVNESGKRIDSGKGILPANLDGIDVVTNNNSELWAIIQGLNTLPDGWNGLVYSDSQVALGWAFWEFRSKGIPEKIRAALAVQANRMGNCRGILLDGHPTRAQLAAGIGKNNNPVSLHNVFCDAECTALAVKFREDQKEREEQHATAARA